MAVFPSIWLSDACSLVHSTSGVRGVLSYTVCFSMPPSHSLYLLPGHSSHIHGLRGRSYNRNVDISDPDAELAGDLDLSSAPARPGASWERLIVLTDPPFMSGPQVVHLAPCLQEPNPGDQSSCGRGVAQNAASALFTMLGSSSFFLSNRNPNFVSNLVISLVFFWSIFLLLLST